MPVCSRKTQQWRPHLYPRTTETCHSYRNLGPGKQYQAKSLASNDCDVATALRGRRRRQEHMSSGADAARACSHLTLLDGFKQESSTQRGLNRMATADGATFLRRFHKDQNEPRS